MPTHPHLPGKWVYTGHSLDYQTVTRVSQEFWYCYFDLQKVINALIEFRTVLYLDFICFLSYLVWFLLWGNEWHSKSFLLSHCLVPPQSDKNQEVAKNVITVPNSVQNYCKTSQQAAAVLCLMTMTKNS